MSARRAAVIVVAAAVCMVSPATAAAGGGAMPSSAPKAKRPPARVLHVGDRLSRAHRRPRRSAARTSALGYGFALQRPAAICTIRISGGPDSFRSLQTNPPYVLSVGEAQWVYWRSIKFGSASRTVLGISDWEVAVATPYSPAPFRQRPTLTLSGNTNLEPISQGFEVYWLTAAGWQHAYRDDGIIHTYTQKWNTYRQAMETTAAETRNC
jgi:hypothetical protein